MLTEGAVAGEISISKSRPDGAVFADFIQSARIELCAALQLLAERAMFVTGATRAAIALEQEGRFIYSAAAGTAAPEVGTEPEAAWFGDCLQTGRPLLWEGKLLVVPIIRSRKSKASGFLELLSENGTLGKPDIASTLRLAQMIDTSLEHMEAAEQAEEVISSPVEQQVQPESPVLRRAPDPMPDPMTIMGRLHQNTLAADVTAAAGVHSCPACGFPISKERTACVDCERLGAVAAPSPALFSLQEQESWLSAHGYTIASLLVSALVGALIYWLR